MPALKDLHSRWQTAKKNSKLMWDELGRLTMDASSAHRSVTHTVGKFPSFSKGMGPALDELDKLVPKKDVKDKDLPKHKESIKKQKKIAVEAVGQYKSDVGTMQQDRKKVKVPTLSEDDKKNAKYAENVKRLQNVVEAADKYVKELADTLVAIENELKKIPD